MNNIYLLYFWYWLPCSKLQNQAVTLDFRRWKHANLDIFDNCCNKNIGKQQLFEIFLLLSIIRLLSTEIKQNWHFLMQTRRRNIENFIQIVPVTWYRRLPSDPVYTNKQTNYSCPVITVMAIVIESTNSRSVFVISTNQRTRLSISTIVLLLVSMFIVESLQFNLIHKQNLLMPVLSLSFQMANNN